jgi:hypothetical protein
MAAAVEVFVQLGGSGVVGFDVWVIECVVRARVCVGARVGLGGGRAARRYPAERNRLYVAVAAHVRWLVVVAVSSSSFSVVPPPRRSNSCTTATTTVTALGSFAACYSK